MQSSVADRLKDHVDSISPGTPYHLGAQHIGMPNPFAQGDLYVRLLPLGTNPPKGYFIVEKPADADRQLAIEAGAGSHHRLGSLSGATLYRPDNWGQDETDLRGPFLILAEPNTIVHEPGHDRPHGSITIEVPCCVEIRYQRNLDAETRKEIRARD